MRLAASDGDAYDGGAGTAAGDASGPVGDAWLWWLTDTCAPLCQETARLWETPDQRNSPPQSGRGGESLWLELHHTEGLVQFRERKATWGAVPALYIF